MSHSTLAAPSRGFSPVRPRLPVADKIVFALRSAEREIVDIALTAKAMFNRAMARARREHRARVLEREMARLDPRLQRDIGYGPDRFGHSF
jgi:hypothetical protein